MQIEHDIDSSKQKKTNTSKIVAILIVITVLVLIGITVAIMLLKEPTLTVTVDGVKVSVSDDMFVFTDSGEVYISIKDIASYVSYEAHNGEYKGDTEDTNKVYVEAEDGTETASFFLNSTTISKVAPDSEEDYENIEISEPVMMLNEKLYVSSEGFIVGFNALFSYDAENYKITIQTLPYLVSYYSSAITNLGYDSLSEEFNNQKALIYGMIVVYKDSNGKYGVINSAGEEIISPRYSEIEFVESTKEFIITNSSGKVGIVYADGETKITVAYDSIKVIDSSLGLYLVQSNNKYGVINSNEKLIVHIEYDSIGIDTTDFSTDNITNQYILFDSLIPVELNGKWGFFDTEGNKITDVEFDTIGCDNSHVSNKVVNNTAVIGDMKVVVVSKDGVYGGIDAKGNYVIPLAFEYIYSITSGGETTYWIVYNGEDYSAEDYINTIRERYNIDENGDEIVEDRATIEVDETSSEEESDTENTENEVLEAANSYIDSVLSSENE